MRTVRVTACGDAGRIQAYRHDSQVVRCVEAGGVRGDGIDDALYQRRRVAVGGIAQERDQAFDAEQRTVARFGFGDSVGEQYERVARRDETFSQLIVDDGVDTGRRT